jgi:hypothetical protein
MNALPKKSAQSAVGTTGQSSPIAEKVLNQERNLMEQVIGFRTDNLACDHLFIDETLTLNLPLLGAWLKGSIKLLLNLPAAFIKNEVF